MVLADEINRTPPKTQAALLEAMQEHRVTSGDETNELPEPFFVLATQNPIEQEGTYPLPEAQLDRFMFMTLVRYPTAEDEIQIMKQATSNYKADLSRLLDGEKSCSFKRSCGEFLWRITYSPTPVIWSVPPAPASPACRLT